MKSFGAKGMPLVGFTLLISFGAMLAGCRKGQEETAPQMRPAMPVRVEPVVVRALTRQALYTGSVEPTRVARMASPAEGPVTACAVREGDHADQGSILVRVGRSGIVESNLAAANDELERQQSDFQRVERLVETGAFPAEQLELARSALRRAEAQVAAAVTSADDYDIHAPWSGVISDVHVAEGNYVAPRTPLVDMYDPASLRVRFSVPERDARWIQLGSVAPVTLDAFPGQVFDAHIERIYPRLDAKTRTLTVEADLATEEPLFSGMFARITAPLETVAGATVIPAGAMVALPDGQLVVYVVDDGIALRRFVRIGLETGGFMQVLEGIEPGENVVAQGQESLRDGAPVRILPTSKLAGQDTSKGSAP